MALLAVEGVCTRMLLYPIMYKSAMLCNNRSRCSVDGEDEGRVMPTWVALNVRQCRRWLLMSSVEGRYGEQQEPSTNYLVLQQDVKMSRVADADGTGRQ